MNNNPIAIGVPKPSSRDDSRSKRSSKRDKGDEEDRDAKAKRREKEDRDAKRKARPSDDTSSSTPGAHASTGDHKSNRKSGRGSTADDPKDRSSRTSRSPHRDEKAAYRSSRKDGSASLPRARAERHSPSRTKRDEKAAYRSNRSSTSAPGARTEKSPSRSRDEKGKERRFTRATKPGVESATSSQDRSKSKSSGGRSKDGDINIEGLGQIGENEETVVAASIVEDSEEDETTKKEKEQARIQAMVAAETERERQRLEAENQRQREEAERAEAERKAKKKKQRNMIVCAVIVLLIIGGGVGAYFALSGSSSSDAVKQTSGQAGEETDSSSSPTENPSNDPSSNPTNAPTVFRKYELPSKEDCERIAAGIPLEGEENMDVKSFNIGIDVNLVDDLDTEPLIPDIQSGMEKYIIPDLIGCPVAESRRGLQTNNQVLTWENIRYAIAKAGIILSVSESETCQGTVSTTCTVLTATITVTVREPEKVLNLISILSTVFRAGENIRLDLQLQDPPFDTVTVVYIRSNDPTTAPTLAPTGTASEDPTMAPTSSPSTSPTPAPAIGPTTPAPTDAPSNLPSEAPTWTDFATNNTAKYKSQHCSFHVSELRTFVVAVGDAIFHSIHGTQCRTHSAARSPAPTSGPTSGPTFRPTTQAPTSIYLGCFQDDANRVFDMMPGGIFTVEGCITFCRDLGYPYSAIQFGSQCFCGNQYDSLGTASNCNSRCVDPADQYCGGPFANSVYMSGAPLTSPVPALESNLYCGCTGDVLPGGSRDLPHRAPYTDLSQVGCIHYCKSQGYNFAGLQWVSQCWCGDDAGSYGTSLNCFTVDKDHDGVVDKCFDSSVGACYDDSTECECGGADANTLFRTSQAVPCPASIPPTQDYLGCKQDQLNPRDLSVLGTARSSIANCKNICKDIGFAYSAIQHGAQCYCGNSYGNYGASGSCTRSCIVDWRETGCGNAWINSVYWSGAAVALVADLEENLYCGCTRDEVQQRDLDHMAPYIDLGQKACIHYCLAKGYDFAGLQLGNQCWCGNNPGTHSFSQSCTTGCRGQERSNCYEGTTCTCGGSNANDLFRTTTSVSCPS